MEIFGSENVPYFELVIGFMVIVYLLESLLDYRQHQKYKIKEMPENLKKIVPENKFVKGLRNSLSFSTLKQKITEKFVNSARIWAYKKQLWILEGFCGHGTQFTLPCPR